MMMKLKFLLVLALATLVRCQRPSFAGTRPIGYPVVTTTEGLEDRFGVVDGTTPRLPIEANGDWELVKRLSKLPIDKQPFWFINWQALEAHRQNPQTYPQRPSPFVDPPQNTGSNSFNLGNSNSGNTGNANSGISGSANSGVTGSTTHGNAGGSLGNLNSVVSLNSGNLNSGSAFTVPSSSLIPPKVANRNSFGASSSSKSANENAAVSNSVSSLYLAVEDKFSGGIEPNRYYETQTVKPNLGLGSSN